MNSQFKKGALELCVLAQLEHEDKYGYQLTDAISSQIEIASGTLYLILKRLKDEGLVETYLKESLEGPARKYYHLTAQGMVKLKEARDEWRSFVSKIDQLI